MIVELYEDQVVDQVGLKLGDCIIFIDGKDVVGKMLEQVNNILCGFFGMEVELEI